MADGIDDGGIAVEHPVREVPLAQVEPDPFDRVQFRRIGRQTQQGYVGRDDQVVAGVPAGAVEYHDGVLVLGKRGREASQELVHRRGRDGGQHQAEIPAGDRFDGGEDIGKAVALIDRPARAQATQPPAAARPAFLAEPGFILEIQRDPLARMRPCRAGESGGEHLF